MTNQQYQEPFLAIVIDPHRTMAAGKVEIGAFRTYPAVRKPSSPLLLPFALPFPRLSHPDEISMEVGARDACGRDIGRWLWYNGANSSLGEGGEGGDVNLTQY